MFLLVGAAMAIGMAELLILALVGLVVLGVPAALIALVVWFALRDRRPSSAEYAELLAENQRLRDELDRLKRQG